MGLYLQPVAVLDFASLTPRICALASARPAAAGAGARPCIRRPCLRKPATVSICCSCQCSWPLLLLRCRLSRGLCAPVATSCRDSRRRLDRLLRDWADWHADRYPPGYVPPLVESGAVTYAPEQMHLGSGASGGGGGGAAVWEDRPAQPVKEPAEVLWFNVSYEKARCGMYGRAALGVWP